MNGNAMGPVMIMMLIALGSGNTLAQKNSQGRPADKPLYRDPVYDGAADPVVIPMWSLAATGHLFFILHIRAEPSKTKIRTTMIQEEVPYR